MWRRLSSSSTTRMCRNSRLAVGPFAFGVLSGTGGFGLLTCTGIHEGGIGSHRAPVYLTRLPAKTGRLNTARQVAVACRAASLTTQDPRRGLCSLAVDVPLTVRFPLSEEVQMKSPSSLM